jgi:hypothetical protein
MTVLASRMIGLESLMIVQESLTIASPVIRLA